MQLAVIYDNSVFLNLTYKQRNKKLFSFIVTFKKSC